MPASIPNSSVRKDAAKHLAQMESRYRGLLEAAPDAMVVVNQGAAIVLLNVQAEKRFGYRRDELLGQMATSIIPEGFAERLIADDLRSAEDALAQQIGTGLELTGRRKDGSEFPIELMLSLLQSDDGILVTAAIRDISIRKEAEKHLAQMESRYRGLLEAAPDAMVVVNQGGEIVLLNVQAEKRFGYRRDELLGQMVTSIIPEGFAERLIADDLRSAEDALAQQIGTGLELTGRRKDGSEFPIELMLSPLQSDDGILVTAAIRDISIRKEESARVERLKDDFVSTVSHELRTPLTSIAASLALLVGNAAGPLPEAAKRLLAIAHSNSQRLVRLINDILDVEKMESGAAFFDLKRVELLPLVEQAIEANRDFAETFDVQIRLTPRSAAVDVRADPDRLMQVVTNLLSNAVKFSPRSEEVVVSVEERRGLARISVRDHGYGIPDEFKHRIFQKFAQADVKDGCQTGGTGLGLSIVKEIVGRLGGEVSFDEAPDGGTIFSVELPTWENAVSHRPELVNKSELRVLLCEDDPQAAVVLSKRLQQEGFITDVALTAAEAIARVQAVKYAAILVDLQRSEGDGIGLIKQLRAQPQIYNTLLVVLSADSKQAANGQRPSTLLNVLDWLNKPIDVERLVRVLDRPIVRDRSTRPRILHFDSDHDALRVVAEALGADAEVMSVDSIDKARRALAASRFDVAVLDVALAMGSGVELLHELHDEEGDAIPVVVFSPQEENAEFATQVRAALINSPASVDTLIATLRRRLIDNKSNSNISTSNMKSVA
jgi:PAS domain S-box-containing protein